MKRPKLAKDKNTLNKKQQVMSRRLYTQATEKYKLRKPPAKIEFQLSMIEIRLTISLIFKWLWTTLKESQALL